MKFAFTDEQQMLQDTTNAFLSAKADSSSLRSVLASEAGFDESLWQTICTDMYWQGVAVPESAGGLGLGGVELAIIVESAGEALLASPLFAVSQSVLALRECADSDTAQSLYELILEGVIVALAGTSARADWSDVGVVAEQEAGQWVLSGESRFVPYGHAASRFLVAAQLESSEAASQLGLFVIDAEAGGVSVHRTPTMDQSRPMATVTLDAVKVDSAACLSTDADEALDTVLAMSRILTAADQVGVAQASLDSSVAYTSERVQFDRTIASFQAIKHKAADMMLKVESARSLVYYAACIIDAWYEGSANRDTLIEASLMASACAGDAAFFNAGSGIQMHGGVGITEEYDIQLYFKRARSTESYLGRPSEMREQLAVMLLDGVDS